MGGSSKYVDFARAKRMMVNPPYSTAKLKMDQPAMFDWAALNRRPRQVAGEVKARKEATRIQASEADITITIDGEVAMATQAELVEQAEARLLEKLKTVETAPPHTVYDPPPKDCRCEQCTKGRALHSLWKETAEALVFLHPNPSTKVTVDVRRYTSCLKPVEIYLRMDGLLDTDDVTREARMMGGFCMRFNAKTWPGREAAEVALIGAWLAYVQHEAMELVKQAKPRERPGVLREGGCTCASCVAAAQERPPWHPHQGSALTKTIGDLIDEGLYGDGQDGCLRRLARLTAGPEADVLFDKTAEQARVEWDTRVRVLMSEDQ